jgi:glucosamine--fructose-6-phosphate aminotransferase (isomerizing)
MCGIAGVYGESAAFKSLMLTLGQLERGVEGCGVAYICDREIRIVKDPVHPVEFMAKRINEVLVDTEYAISHNRLPSVGKVSYENTHPFMSCNRRFAFAHNGHAFVNHLRDYLIETGHKIAGETDSEILAHLLEQYLEEYGDMVKAVKELVENNLSGTIIVLMKDGEIYTARSGFNTLHYAVKDGEIYIASSDKAIKYLVEGRVKVISVGDGEIIKVKDGKIEKHRAKARGWRNIYRIYNDYGLISYADVDMFLF